MGFILTHSGEQFDPEYPEECNYKIQDIAVALSKECRYGGHSNGLYTVAQHSVLCSQMVDPKNALAALMHDATEAYVKDIPKPIKRALGASYAELELRVWESIAKKFNLPVDLPKEVHEADQEMMRVEIRGGIVPDTGNPAWDKYLLSAYKPYRKVSIDGVWSSQAAYNSFLHRWGELTGEFI